MKLVLVMGPLILVFFLVLLDTTIISTVSSRPRSRALPDHTDNKRASGHPRNHERLRLPR